MKKQLFLICIFIVNLSFAQEVIDKEIVKPQVLVQKQLEAYNIGDIEAFLEPYAEDIEVYNFPNTLVSKGKDKIRPTYELMFNRYKKLHCKLVNRIIVGNTVIDQENVTFTEEGQVYKAIAIYKIENNKIAKVYFIH